MATIRITNLRLRTIIGANDWERDLPQNIIINITIDFDATQSSKSDNLDDTIDYKIISKEIIKQVEASSFFLLEALADMIMKIVLKHPLVQKASVCIDKPGALRFSDSVSVELTEDVVPSTLLQKQVPSSKEGGHLF